MAAKMPDSTSPDENHECKPLTSLPPQNSFLGIPRELRDLIYNQILRVLPLDAIDSIADDGHNPFASPRLHILLTCRQIYHEACSLAFKTTTFHLGSASQDCAYNSFKRGVPFSCERRALFRSLPAFIRDNTTKISFTISSDTVKETNRRSIFDQYDRFVCVDAFTLLPALKKITLYRNKYDCFSHSVVYQTLVLLIGKVESLQEIEYFDNRHPVWEGKFEEVRRRFAKWLQNELDLFPYRNVKAFWWCRAGEGLIRTVNVDEETKSVVLGLTDDSWMFRNLWGVQETVEPKREVKITMASFDEARAMFS